MSRRSTSGAATSQNLASIVLLLDKRRAALQELSVELARAHNSMRIRIDRLKSMEQEHRDGVAALNELVKELETEQKRLLAVIRRGQPKQDGLFRMRLSDAERDLLRRALDLTPLRAPSSVKRRGRPPKKRQLFGKLAKQALAKQEHDQLQRLKARLVANLVLS